MQPNSPSFIIAVQKRLLDRLTILARHRAPSSDLQRGGDLFGYGSLTNRETAEASVEFLRMLLLCLQKWAVQFAVGPDGKMSAFAVQYEILQKEGVSFQGMESQPGRLSRAQSDSSLLAGPGLPKGFKRDIDRITSCARSLIAQLAAGASLAATVELAADLRTYQSQLFAAIETRASKPGSELELQLLIEATEAIDQALERFDAESQKRSNESSSAPARSPNNHRDIDAEIAALKAEITDMRNELFAKRTVAQGNKSPEQLRKEAEDRVAMLKRQHEAALAELPQNNSDSEVLLPGLQQRIYELQAVLDNTKADRVKVMQKLDRAHRQLEERRLENSELRERIRIREVQSPRNSSFNFAGSPEPRQADIDLSDYATQRISVDISAVAGRVSALPVCNYHYFRSMCFHDQGALFENETVLVAYQSKIAELEGQFRILVANKSEEDVAQLTLFVPPDPVEGVHIDTEPAAAADLSPKGKLYRIYRISVFRPFHYSLCLSLSFQFRGGYSEFNLQLPILYPHFLKPTVLSPGRALANWEALGAWEAVHTVPALSTELKSMRDVAAVVRFNANFVVLNEKNLPELGRERVLGLGGINEYLACVLVTVEAKGGALPGCTVAVRCRSQESRSCLLKCLLDFLAQK